MIKIYYKTYTLYVDNSCYVCGDLLNISIKKVGRKKKTRSELYCLQYVSHLVSKTGLLYLYCTSHWAIADRVILIFEDRDGALEHISSLYVDGTQSMYLSDEVDVICMGNSLAYYINDNNIVSKKLLKDC